MKGAACALLCAFGLLAAGSALACDDHVGQCKLDAIRTTYKGGYFKLMASATCDRGRAVIRVYDGDKFIGVVDGYIRHHALDHRERHPAVPVAEPQVRHRSEVTPMNKTIAALTLMVALAG